MLATALAQRISQAFDGPLLVGEHKLQTGVFIGMACWPTHARDAAGLHRAASLALAAAFLEDPVLGHFLFRQDSFKASGAALFFSHILASQYLSRRSKHLCVVGPAAAPGGKASSSSEPPPVTGVALWQPPGVQQGLPLSGMLRMVLLAPSIFGWTGVLRALKVGMLVDAQHPAGRHYYLGFLGVAPSWQGQGLGAELLRPVLREADAEGCDCYLENSNPGNTAFYERLGFRVTATVPLGPSGSGAPTVWGMLRRPGAGALLPSVLQLSQPQLAEPLLLPAQKLEPPPPPPPPQSSRPATVLLAGTFDILHLGHELLLHTLKLLLLGEER
jgi:ribosomal protein S18 acetylase RimI-like enzyme